VAIEGVDYAWSRPDPHQLYALGKRFACRYLSYNTSGKNLTQAEADRLIAAGVAVVSNWENAVGDATQGYDVGRRYAADASNQARACGAPADRPIYFSVDFDISGASDKTIEAIRQYFAGIRSILGRGRTGVYGGYDTIRLAAGEGWAAWLWQTYAWSAGRWHPANNIEQYRNNVIVAGAECDLDRALTADYGQWGDDDVSVSDVRTGIAQMADEAANRSTPSGRNYDNDLAMIFQRHLGPLTAKVDQLNAKVDQLNAKVDQLNAKVDQLLQPAVPIPAQVNPTALVDTENVADDQPTE
jgi:X-X-X-Leu-X-X-Gly heptad repeat protein